MFTIGQIEKLTGIKAHVLRYWEEVVPAISPLKTDGGHRIYSQRHLEIIMRMKYLIQTRGFTIEGARNQIIAESDAYTQNRDALQTIQELKRELSELYLLVSGGKDERR